MSTIKLPLISLLFLISFAAVNAVLFTPALPAISDYFEITDRTAQLTVTLFLLGYALGQLVYGPVANRYGRKSALYIGISIQILSSFACVLAGILHLYPMLMIARFFLAIGSGVGLKVSVTMVNESYPPQKAGETISLLMLAFAVAPGLAVALGGILNTYFSWMSCFYACALYGIILLFFVTKLPETLKQKNRDALKWRYLANAYRLEFSNLKIIAGSILVGVCGSFLYIFSALAPFIAIDLFGMTSENYGYANLIPLTGLAFGSLLSAKLTQRFPLLKIIKLGIGIATLGVGLMLTFVWLKLPILMSIFFPMFIINIGEIMILANASTTAMTLAKDKSHGSAVINFIGVGMATLGVLTVGLFKTAAINLPLIYCILCLISFFSFILLQPKN